MKIVLPKTTLEVSAEQVICFLNDFAIANGSEHNTAWASQEGGRRIVINQYLANPDFTRGIWPILFIVDRMGRAYTSIFDSIAIQLRNPFEWADFLEEFERTARILNGE